MSDLKMLHGDDAQAELANLTDADMARFNTVFANAQQYVNTTAGALGLDIQGATMVASAVYCALGQAYEVDVGDKAMGLCFRALLGQAYGGTREVFFYPVTMKRTAEGVGFDVHLPDLGELVRALSKAMAGAVDATTDDNAPTASAFGFVTPKGTVH